MCSLPRLLPCLAALALAAPALAASPAELLRRADAYRLPDGPTRVETEVELWEGGRVAKTKRFTVYSAPGRRSLVVFRSPEEAGQKVLMVDDKYWLLLPRTKQPLRITPMQKLLGEASTGDVATMTWGEDYEGRAAGAEAGDPAVLKLDLKSTRAGSSYDRIELWVTEADGVPVRAKLYLASGKLAKEASYGLGTLAGRSRVVSMTLVDRIQQDRKTVIRYTAMEPRTLADKLFNPAFLVQDGGSDL